MKEVEIFEQAFMRNDKKVGKIAILRFISPSNSNVLTNEILDNAVSHYTGHTGYNHYVESTNDNPSIRIIIIGIDELEFIKFRDLEK